MVDSLYIASAEATSVRLWDCFDPTGTNNPYGVKTAIRHFTPGHAAEPMLIPKGFGRDGSSLTDFRQSHIVMELTQAIEATSIDNLTAAWGELFRLLQLPNMVMVRQFLNEAVPTYYDLLAADPETIMRGDTQDMRQAVEYKRDKIGLEMNIFRQPWRRGGIIDSDINLLKNAMFWHDVSGDDTPDDWTKDNGTLEIMPDTGALRITQNTASDKIHQDYSAAAGTQFTASIEGKKVSGDRTVSLKLYSQPSGVQVGSVDITAAAFGTRVSCTGTIAGGDNAIRMKIVYTGGSTSTVVDLRRAQLELGTGVSTFRVGTQTLPNDPRDSGGIFVPIHIEGDMPAPVETRLKAGSGAQLIRADYGAKWDKGRDGLGALADLPRIGYINLGGSGQGWTVSYGSGTALSSGMARTSLTANWKRWLSRVVATRTSDLGTFRGPWEILLRARSNHSYDWRIGLSWGPQTAFAITSLPYRRLLQEGDTRGYQWLSLGDITLPDDRPLSGLRLELFAGLDEKPQTGSPTVTLDMRDLIFIPRSHRGSIIGSTNRNSQRYVNIEDFISSSTSVGGETMNAGTIVGSVGSQEYRLKLANDSAGTEAQLLPAGTWAVRFGMRATVAGDRVYTAAQVRVVDVTGTPAIVKQSRIEWADTKGLKEKTLHFTSEAGHSYEFQYKLLNNTSGVEVRLSDIYRRGVAVAAANQTWVGQPGVGAMLEDTSDAFLSFLRAQGDLPFTLEPGSHVATIWTGELHEPGDDFPSANPNMDSTFGYAYSPRYFG